MTVWERSHAGGVRRDDRLARAARGRRLRQRLASLARDAVWAGCVFGTLGAAAWVVSPHLDADGARAALADEGYRDVRITGTRWRGCPARHNFYRTTFAAAGPTGTEVDGVVCRGPLTTTPHVRVRTWQPPEPVAPPAPARALWTGGGLAVTSLREGRGRDGERVLRGTLVNLTDETYEWVYVDVVRIDLSGRPVDTVRVSTGSVGGAGPTSLWGGHTWRFREPVEAATVASLRVVRAGDV